MEAAEGRICFCQHRVKKICSVNEKKVLHLLSGAECYNRLAYLASVVYVISPHIDVEAGLSLMKSTIAESGMGVTSRTYRTKHIAF